MPTADACQLRELTEMKLLQGWCAKLPTVEKEHMYLNCCREERYTFFREYSFVELLGFLKRAVLIRWHLWILQSVRPTKTSRSICVSAWLSEIEMKSG
ncbi:hypothetical protein Taro_041723 [Colocasia esculenta]|uniref:Uncharacterized protein n=1 Tax=Colocasia esculenta TaxID=4460 RepID=A0A843WUE1_COLES|nr:hypothetical protein [Colocasia esculenta]